MYAICLDYDEGNFYGKSITFTYKDTEPIDIINRTDRADAETQLGEGNVGDPYDNDYNDWEELGDGISSEDFDHPVSCPEIINMEEGKLGWLLNTMLNYIRIIGPVLVVLLSAIDFIKAVVGFDEKAMKEAQNKLIIRLVAAVALFLVPTLVQLLLSFINASTCTVG